jgi:hypothetical protein
MMRVLGIGLVAALAAVALPSQDLAAAEAPKLKNKGKAPAASFSELQGITTKVDVIESRSRPRQKIKAKKK